MPGKEVKNMTLAALFIALGVLLPIVFHAVGLGSIFLPMLLPVAVSAYFLPVSVAACVGAITPLVSALLTGMPPLSPPIAQVMVFECAALAICAAWLHRNKRLPVIISLLSGLLVSRIVLLLLSFLLMPLLGLPAQVFSWFFVIKGTPGIIMIMVLVPLVVRYLQPKGSTS